MSENSNKGTALLRVLLLLACGGCFFFYNKYKGGKEQILDLKATRTALLRDTIEFYSARNGQLIVTVDKLTLDKKELDLYNTSLKKELKNMRIKLRDVQSITTITSETNVRTPALPLRDTNITQRGEKVKAKAFSWSDWWIEMSGLIVNDSIRPVYSSKDTITSIGEKVPKFRLFGIRFGTKGVKLKSSNKNPHSKITYQEYIELK